MNKGPADRMQLRLSAVLRSSAVETRKKMNRQLFLLFIFLFLFFQLSERSLLSFSRKGPKMRGEVVEINGRKIVDRDRFGGLRPPTSFGRGTLVCALRTTLFWYMYVGEDESRSLISIIYRA